MRLLIADLRATRAKLAAWESYRAKIIDHAAACCEVGNKGTANTLLNMLGWAAPGGYGSNRSFQDLLASREADGTADATRAHAERVRAIIDAAGPRPDPPVEDTPESLRALRDRLIRQGDLDG